MQHNDWYKDAVIYEVHVRAFQDSNNDGIGDFKGLTSRLDYIQALGVNTIWLLPFYPSPGRDDGYDIAEYLDVHPQYGTMADFHEFIEEAHRRSLRVITELVINHTSDQHPWFQAARTAPPGSPERDYYVWSDTPDLYSGTRIIFTDTEVSNWTWDPVAKAYFWHRFFSHQPDLNFDNPEVENAVLRVMRFWLDQGVDGLRLDAIPYLVERDGTSNENLPETHAVIKRIRAVIDEHYSDRMLLGEANMWPEDVRDYFADGDECHMAYHFPLMPRMYMAIALEDRYPIVEIMEQTPDIPQSCQWAIFLRNHDELTLEMVTSRERDYMYKMYASDARARLNLGIRRRLAPLMENDIERIKLMNSLLLSMPGSPIIYYGDEIGMGDNLYLGDRNGVRTPMQWSPDRNAGFSRADPEGLYLPPIMDPIYGYNAVNVEAQLRDRSSLLSWMTRLLQIRTSLHAFGRGTLRFIRPGNRKVLCYVREYQDEILLCVVNLSRSAQPVELWLGEFKGMVPTEMLGRTAFPPIGDLPYLLSLPSYGFFWFRLSPNTAAPAWHEERLAPEDVPIIVMSARWDSLFPDRVTQWRGAEATKLRARLEKQLLPAYVSRQRWYAAKGEAIVQATLGDHVQWEAPQGGWLLAMFDVHNEGTSAPYFMPLALIEESVEGTRWAKLQPAMIARARRQAIEGIMADAFADENFSAAIVRAIGANEEMRGTSGTFHFVPTREYAHIRGAEQADLSINVMREGSNTSVKVGQRLFLKAYRRLHAGVTPELEIGRYLTEVAQFPNIVPAAGYVEYRADDGTTYTLAMLQGFVPNQGDAWEFTANYLARFLQDRRALTAEAPAEEHAIYLGLMRTLGKRTAQLHAALAGRKLPDAAIASTDGAFGAEPVTGDDLAQWRARAIDEARASLDRLRGITTLPESAATLAAHVLRAESTFIERLGRGAAPAPGTIKCRVHGDYHLAQVLLQRDDFILIDFEGEPARSLEERRRKSSPLRDVAGMLRSFSYARRQAEVACSKEATDCATYAPLLEEWERQARAAFLGGYDETARKAGLYRRFEDVQGLLDLFEIEKAFYELRYELDNRPDWADIPLEALARFAATSR